MSPLARFADFNLAFQGMMYPMETDHMGHANVRYYSRAFNEAAYFTFTTAGVTPAYMRANGRGMAAVTENVLYRREILPGDLIAIRTCLIGFSEKSLHVWGVMIDAVTDEVCDQRPGVRASRHGGAQGRAVAAGHPRQGHGPGAGAARNLSRAVGAPRRHPIN